MQFGKLTSSTNWQRLNGQKLGCSLNEAVENILIKEQQAGNQMKVCIGTDSQVKGQFVEFVTVIVFIRTGKGGFMFKHRATYDCKLQTKRRMLMEVSDSIDVGYGLNELLEIYDVDMEIHADINKQSKFQSNLAFKEAMGYVLGMGFVFVAKPDAYASSTCADRVVKGGSWPKAVKKVA